MILLPAPLVALLNQLGLTWPEGDESKIFAYAMKWNDMAEQTRETREDGRATATKVLATNEGENAEAYRESVTAEDGPLTRAGGLSTGLQLGGGALILTAAGILVLKIKAIIELVQLLIKELQAYAAAGPTFGASLAMIPTWRALAKIAIKIAMGTTMQSVQGDGTTSGSNPVQGIIGQVIDGFIEPTRRLPGQEGASTAPDTTGAPGADTSAPSDASAPEGGIIPDDEGPVPTDPTSIDPTATMA